MPRSGPKSGSVLQNAFDKSATDDTNELLRIETDLLNAYVHRDLSVRDRYVADEFVGVDSSGSTYSKQQDMQDMKDGTFALKSFKEEDVQVRLLGDSAVVTGRNTATSVYKGKEDSFTIRFVDTFLRCDGRWQMVYSQDTNVADGTPDLRTGSDEIRDMVAKYANSINEADTSVASQVWLDSLDVSFIHPLGHEHGFDQIKQNVYGRLMGEPSPSGS